MPILFYQGTSLCKQLYLVLQGCRWVCGPWPWRTWCSWGDDAESGSGQPQSSARRSGLVEGASRDVDSWALGSHVRTTQRWSIIFSVLRFEKHCSRWLIEMFCSALDLGRDARRSCRRCSVSWRGWVGFSIGRECAGTQGWQCQVQRLGEEGVPGTGKTG